MHSGTPAHQLNLRKQIVRRYPSLWRHKMHIISTIIDQTLHGFPPHLHLCLSDSFSLQGKVHLCPIVLCFNRGFGLSRPQNVQLMILVMIEQHCVMCVVELMALVKFSGVGIKHGNANDQNGK